MKKVLIIGANNDEIQGFSKLLNHHTANVIVCGAGFEVSEKKIDFIAVDDLMNKDFVPNDDDSSIVISKNWEGFTVKDVKELMMVLEMDEQTKIQKQTSYKITKQNPVEHFFTGVSRGKGARARNRSAFKNKFRKFVSIQYV
jgi:hypothetical protein